MASAKISASMRVLVHPRLRACRHRAPAEVYDRVTAEVVVLWCPACGALKYPNVSRASRWWRPGLPGTVRAFAPLVLVASRRRRLARGAA